MIILYVDDDLDDRVIISEVFREIDPSINCLTVCDGRQAIEFLNSTGPLPDYIFLDINMPYHDGFSWLKGIREKGYEDLPVIMYTNSGNPEHIIQAYRDGADLYYIKPTSFSDLMKGLKALMDLDWSDPLSIKETYWQDGKYATFKVA